MHRLFVALRPPRPIREALLAIAGGVTGAHWQDDAQLHLTLRFVGEVDGRMANDVADALSTVSARAFDLTLDAPGRFDRRGRLDSLWIGVRPHDQVAALHRKVDYALQRVGLPPEGRAFLPHITLARFGTLGGPPDAFVAGAATVAGLSFAVTDFALFESLIGHDGARYTLVERYPLR